MTGVREPAAAAITHLTDKKKYNILSDSLYAAFNGVTY